MNKRMLKLIACCTLLAIVLTGCSSSKLVGQWQTTENVLFTGFEFFSDGTYTSEISSKYYNNYYGDYSVDDNRLKISGFLVEDKTFSFELKGNKLILEYPSGDKCTYTRVK